MNALEFLDKQVLNQDFLLWLNLEKFEEERYKLRWFGVVVHTTDGIELDSFVNEGHS
jgi:hypothetical protein